MAKRKNDKAIATVLVVGGVALLAYLFWPRIKAAASGGQAAGASGPMGLLGRPSMAQGSSGGGAGPASSLQLPKLGASPLSKWISSVLNYGWQAAANMPVTQPDLSGQSIPLEPFNWGGYSPSDFLVTSDVPAYQDNSWADPSYTDLGYLDTQSYDWMGYSPNDFLVTQDTSSIDPYYGADSLSVDNTDLSGDYITS